MRRSRLVLAIVFAAGACLTRSVRAQDPDTRAAGTKVPLVLTVEPAAPAPGAVATSLDSLITTMGVPLTIHGAATRELAGVRIRITVTPIAKSPTILSATVQNATFQTGYVPSDTGEHLVDAVDPSGRFRAQTRFFVRGIDVADHDIPQDEIEETFAALTDDACKATDALRDRVGELPSSPAATELKRRLDDIERDAKEAMPCGEVPAWASGVDHLNKLRGVAPEMHQATERLVHSFDQWLGAAKRARDAAPQGLAALTQGNVVCDQLDIVVNGFKFLDFYMTLIVKPGDLLQEWAKANVPTKLVGMIPAVRRTAAVKEGVELGWKGVTTYKPTREGGKFRLAATGADRALGHLKMVNAALQYASSRVFEAYCQTFQGPVSGTMDAEFMRGDLVWWYYTVNISGKLVLRYPKNAKAGVIALTGEFMGNATKFESHDNAIMALFPGLAQGVVYRQIRLEPLSMADFPHVLAPNLDLTSNPAIPDFNFITSIIDQGGPITQNLLTPAFFRVPVRGELGDTTLRLEVQEAATDFEDNRVKVIKIILPVLSLMPEVVSYALPYKGARFLIWRAMQDGPVTITVKRTGDTMTIDEKFDRERSAGGAKGVYHLTIKACNPGC